MDLVALIGLPGAGKSSFHRARYAGTHVHVSKDLFGSAKRKNEKQMRLVEAALRSGRSVVVDNTNPRRADRAPLIEAAHRLGTTATGIPVAAPGAQGLRRHAP